MADEKPIGRGKGYRATRESHATEDAWKAAVNEAIDDLDERVAALEAGETPPTEPTA